MSVSGTVFQQYCAIVLIIIIVMGNCCYYKYGYCYYCSPGKVAMIFFFFLILYIVIWSPAGQRHNMTMVEMNPSLHSVCVELDQIRGVNVNFREFPRNHPDVGTE